METIVDAFDKLQKSQNQLNIDTAESIQKMLLLLEQNNHEETKQLASKLTESSKDLYSTTGKYAKAVERKFKTDLDSSWDPKAFDGKQDTIAQILIRHFVREGRFDLAEIFAKEAGLEFDQNLHSQFVEMFHVQEALRNQDSNLAIQWATEHSDFLNKNDSHLEFNLHQLKYLNILKSGDIPSALRYAHDHFHRFAHKHLKGIFQ